MARSVFRIIAALILILCVLWFVLTYQPVRHVMYNNSGVVLQVQQEHFGRIIPAGGEADLNWPFDTPLMASFWAKGIPASIRVRFGENGELRIYSRQHNKPLDISLPED